MEDAPASAQKPTVESQEEDAEPMQEDGENGEEAQEEVVDEEEVPKVRIVCSAYAVASPPPHATRRAGIGTDEGEFTNDMRAPSLTAPRILAYGRLFRVYQGGTHIGQCPAVYHHEEVRADGV